MDQIIDRVIEITTNKNPRLNIQIGDFYSKNIMDYQMVALKLSAVNMSLPGAHPNAS